MKKKTQNTKFSKFFKIYMTILITLCFIFLMYVLNTLYQYEDSYPQNYMYNVTKNITKMSKNGKGTQICKVNGLQVSNLENQSKTYDDALKQIFTNSNITIQENKNNTSTEPIYDILADNNKILTVSLNKKKTNNRLGMFIYPVWEVKECVVSADRGLFYYDITVPDNYEVSINGTVLGEENISNTAINESYQKLTEYVKLPNIVTYKVDNLLTKPYIQIKDGDNNGVTYAENGHTIELQNSYITGNSYDEIKDKIVGDLDVLQIAENWSLFLTDDLQGTRHGFNTLRNTLIKGSSFYDMAYAWATSVDITFVSRHTLKNPAFTNTEVKDFVVYNEKAFSCVVSLEKNMKIANGQEKTDKMYDRLYFVYYDDPTDNVKGETWKLVDMKAIVEE